MQHRRAGFEGVKGFPTRTKSRWLWLAAVTLPLPYTQTGVVFRRGMAVAHRRYKCVAVSLLKW